MTSVLGRLRVRARVLLLVAITMVSAGVLASAHFVSEAEQARILEDKAQFDELATQTQLLQSASLQMRRREKDFLLRKDMKYSEQYQQKVTEVLKTADAIMAIRFAAPMSNDLAKLKAGVQEAANQFQNVVALQQALGLNETDGLQGALRAAVHEAEKSIADLGEDALIAKMLMMRRHEKDFMLRGGEKYVSSLVERKAEFDVLLKASALPGDLQAKVGERIAAYHAGFLAYAEQASAFGAAVSRLSEIYGTVEPMFDQVLAFAAAGRAGLDEQMLLRQKEISLLFAAVTGTTVVFALVLGLVISASVSRPLNVLTALMGRLAKGETNDAVPDYPLRTELGMMAATLRIFRENLIRNRELEAEQKRAEAAANTAAARKELMQRLARDFETSVGEIVGIVSAASTELSATAGAMSTVSANANERAVTVSAAAEQASSNVQMVASATEEMAASVAEINVQVERASNVARKASTNIAQSATEMSTLAERADRIGQVVSMISAIAQQTNLLALNATIESARAGEAGRGFAVVASEVKQLANQTGEATKDIVQLVEAIQGGTRNAVDSINGIGGVIRELDEMASAIAAAVSEQGATTREVARNIAEAATGAQSVSQNMVAVTSASQEAQAASSQLYSSAESLSAQSARLRSEVSRFLETIRAA